MRFKQYLTEKTFNISQDVNFLYDNAFKNFINSLIKNNFKKSNISIVDKRIKEGKDVTLYSCTSKDLPSEEAKKASIVNPVSIKCGVFSTGNYYNPMTKEIQVSITKQVLNMLFNNVEGMVPHRQMKNFYQELNPERIKSTMAHELSHWLNDTLHNRNIKKILDIARELNNTDIKKLGQKSVNMTHFEIDAQIHGIKQLKNDNKETWDQLTLTDVFFKYVALRVTGRRIYKEHGKDIGDIWQKMLVKRMAREKLLGKNMKNFAKYPNDFEG